uniref:(northern house mosquito) hypothetical protein n=1 Tax=Culex pipiens TaxID=7175 RepID=A0A8D8E6K0_CULPI
MCRKNGSHLRNQKKSRSGRTAAAPETSKPIEPIQREGVFARALTTTVIFVLDAFLSARSLSLFCTLSSYADADISLSFSLEDFSRDQQQKNLLQKSFIEYLLKEKNSGESFSLVSLQ